MTKHQHLKLPLFRENVERKKRGFGGGFSLPEGRNKSNFLELGEKKSKELSQNFLELKRKFPIIDPSLIFKIKINQKLHVDTFEKILTSMNINILSIAENKKGYWVVFSEDTDLIKFSKKLKIYGSDEGSNYDFFNAIESFEDIPIEEKIGNNLKNKPLADDPGFVDLELWNMEDRQKNKDFIEQLKKCYPHPSPFRITDQLITKSFVLLRVRLTKTIFDEIIQFKEVLRIDRPAIVQFEPYEMMHPNIHDMTFSAPDNNAMGVLLIDSGITSNHPMLEKCVGGEENFQDVENEVQDMAGHGTAVAGCIAYGDVEKALEVKKFTPLNWLFSAKVMYAEKDLDGNLVNAIYNAEKLLEHQLKDAVESFLSNSEYRIKVVNVSLGNVSEVFRTDYTRQPPLAALIDELAFKFPSVVFIVSAGNQSPRNFYLSIDEITENYPRYLIDNKKFKIINPATSALALTIGSIAEEVKVEQKRFNSEQIKKEIAKAHQPSPFTRVGFGINDMIKPELVEYGGNMVLSKIYGRITEDRGGKLALLNNQTTDKIICFDVGSSFSAAKVSHLAGQVASKFPYKSANFIKNMLLVGSDYPFSPTKGFYKAKDKKGTEKEHLSVAGYGLSQYDRAIHSFDNRAVLWNEGEIGLDQIKVYSLDLPDLFFAEAGKKTIMITLTFTPETRPNRGDSYLGNRMEFHLFHSVEPQKLIEKYGKIENDVNEINIPPELKKFEIEFFPGANIRKVGCHQKAWKEYKRNPKKKPESPFSLVLLNLNKWMTDEKKLQNYCISVVFGHEKEIQLYSAIQGTIQTKARIR